MKCDTCGADADAKSGRFCSHCGANFPDAERITAYEFNTHSERYNSVKTHASYEQLMKQDPKVKFLGQYLISVMVILAGLGFIYFSQFVMPKSPTDTASAIPSIVNFCMLLVPLIIVGTGLFWMFRTYTLSSAPWRRVVAVVVDERISIHSSGDNNRTTAYFCTLQFEEGARKELSTTGKVAGLVTRGDIGIAYIKRDKLLAYNRVAM